MTILPAFLSEYDSKNVEWVLDPLQMFADVSYDISLTISKGNRRETITVRMDIVEDTRPKVRRR